MLDPENVAKITNTVYIGDLTKLPNAVTKFGYVPDIARLWPGDLILTQKSPRTFPLNKTFQKVTTNVGHEWTHAAIYLGDYQIIEATTKGVHINTLFSCIPKSKMRVRRLNLPNTQQHKKKIIGYKIALNSTMSLHGGKYGLSALMLNAYNSIFNKKKNRTRHVDEKGETSLICSGLYAKSVVVAAGIHVEPTNVIAEGKIITPAILASSSKLHDVGITWAEISDS